MQYDVGSQCIIARVPLKLTIFTGLAYGTGLHLEMPRKYSSLAGECILIYYIYILLSILYIIYYKILYIYVHLYVYIYMCIYMCILLYPHQQ